MATLQDLKLYKGQVVYGVNKGTRIVGEHATQAAFKLYMILSDREQQDYDLPEMCDVTAMVAKEFDLGLESDGCLLAVEIREVLHALSVRLYRRSDYLRYQEL